MALTMAFNGMGLDFGSRKKPPFGPFIDEITPSLESV